MADKVLYFPYIRVPGNEWFTRVLLYWDEIGSIVPSEYIYRTEVLGNYMIELLQSGLARQAFPVITRIRFLNLKKLSLN